MNWEAHKGGLLKNHKFRQALKEAEPEYQVARALVLARLKKNLTQKQLALKLGTKQSVVSRVENARTTPSLSFLKRLADVLDTRLEVKFA